MFRKFPLQLKTLKAKKPLPVTVLRGTPGKSSQPELAQFNQERMALLSGDVCMCYSF